MFVCTLNVFRYILTIAIVVVRPIPCDLVCVSIYITLFLPVTFSDTSANHHPSSVEVVPVLFGSPQVFTSPQVTCGDESRWGGCFQMSDVIEKSPPEDHRQLD